MNFIIDMRLILYTSFQNIMVILLFFKPIIIDRLILEYSIKKSQNYFFEFRLVKKILVFKITSTSNIFIVWFCLEHFGILL